MPTPPVIAAAELHRRLSTPQAPRMIDVRTPGEFEAEHIAGSYNVPLDLLREHRDEIVRHPAEDVVLICRSGQRPRRKTCCGAAQPATLRRSSPN